MTNRGKRKSRCRYKTGLKKGLSFRYSVLRRPGKDDLRGTRKPHVSGRDIRM